MTERCRHLPKCRQLACLHKVFLDTLQFLFSLLALPDLELEFGVGGIEICSAFVHPLLKFVTGQLLKPQAFSQLVAARHQQCGTCPGQ